jgi:single-stranded-DNA-specific exonuclease
MVEAALGEVGGIGDSPVVLVASEQWHAGIVGLVASRLVERFGRPAAAIAVRDGVGKGSARSVAGFDMGGAVIAARQAGLLSAGGGHRMAAGFTVEAARIAELHEFLNARMRRAAVEPAMILLDGALNIGGAADLALADAVERLGPFGIGNAIPRFAVLDARLAKADIVGEDHVRCILAGPEGGRLKAIAFRAAGQPLGQRLLAAQGSVLQWAGEIRAEEWQGRRSAQLIVVDAARAGPS